LKRVLNPEAVTFLSGFLSVCWDFSYFMGSCEREVQRLGLDSDYLKELLEGIKLKMCNKIGFSGSTFQTDLRMGCKFQVGKLLCCHQLQKKVFHISESQSCCGSRVSTVLLLNLPSLQ
jgi:hypothetical protein